MDSDICKEADDAKAWVKQHQKEIIERFISEKTPVESPVAIFMAGSPGAGKTEFSRRFIEELGGNIVRIDSDDIRSIIPQYQGNNSSVVQAAATLGVEKLYDFVLRERLHAIIDGTFQKYDKSATNIRRAINSNRSVDILYVYQDPKVAWDFTCKREALEGRNIPKEVFIEALFASNENVKRIKREYESVISLHVILKNISSHDESVWYNVSADQIDKCVHIPYTRTDLERTL